PRAGREPRQVKRLILIAFYLEVGAVLIIVPWSAYWDRNYFAQAVPLIGTVITNNFVRGAVSGLGVLNLLMGLSELAGLIWRRRRDRPSSITSSTLAEE